MNAPLSPAALQATRSPVLPPLPPAAGGMDLGEALRGALQALAANRLRAVLTALGIFIGVAAVIATVAVGAGAREQVLAQIRALGANLLMVTPGSVNQGAVRLGAGQRPNLTWEDAQAIRDGVTLLAGVSGVVRQQHQVVAGNLNWSTGILGADPDIFAVQEWVPGGGRVFTAEEARGARKVAVLGATVAEALFGDEDPILSAKSRAAVTLMGVIMSLRPQPIGEIPAETARVARAAFPRGTVVTRLRDEFHDLYRDEDFRDFYPRHGQPALAPWRLALVTVLQFLENLSDRQAAEAVRARIDWKYALGLELTDAGFHFSVLTEFRARLVAGKAEHLLLDRMLEHFKARGLVRARGKQRTDSTHVLAAVHDLHLLELVAETLRATLDDLAAVTPDWLRGVARPVWFERYARRIEDYRLPKSQEERAVLAREIGADGFLLLDALDAPGAPVEAREASIIGTLRDVWRVHYARDGGQPRLRAGTELPPVGERVQSPHDTEAHYSMKRQLAWLGYKVHVTETCDDDAAHLITHVATCPAMQPDMASTAAIHDQLARKGLLPAEHFVDSGYVDAGLLVSSLRDHAISLEGPVRGVSTSQGRSGRGYEQRDFAIDWEHERVTCPQGKTSAIWRMARDEDGSPRVQAVFSQHDCRPCAARTFCAPGKGARRFIYFHPRPEYEALHAARARMSDPAWQERYHIRAGVEGTISQGVRAFAMRRSRYIGLAKTGLQQICVAVGMNVLRAVHWLDGQPRARTRVTRFASLAQAA